MPAPASEKPGIKTTEFWSMIASQIVLAIIAIRGSSIDPETLSAFSAGLVAVYTAGRSIVKAFQKK